MPVDSLYVTNGFTRTNGDNEVFVTGALLLYSVLNKTNKVGDIFIETIGRVDFSHNFY